MFSPFDFCTFCRIIKQGRLVVEIKTDGCQSGPNAVNFLEHVQVVLSIQAVHRGSLVINLTSPSGTTSTMLPARPLDSSSQGFSQWPFMSVQYWGENPAGVWRVEIEDKSVNPKMTGISNSALLDWSVVLHGTTTDPLAKQDLKISSLFEDRGYSSLSSARPPTADGPKNCHLSCKTCHGSRVDDCGSCFSGYFFHNSQCKLSCPAGFLPMNDTMTCITCPPKCMKCTSPSTCSSCQSQYVLEGGQCVASHSTVNDECLHGTSHTTTLTTSPLIFLVAALTLNL
jgi:subtilisin-like proprotein convertase family protein